MEITPLSIEGAWIVKSTVHLDSRGSLREYFQRNELLEATGIDFSVEQANVSKSNRGVIRGIHYSLSPLGQAKWLTCLSGAILDVIADIRPHSPTFGRVEYIDLKADEGKTVLIGANLGHGFISLEEETIVSYLLSSSYMPDCEYQINPYDETLNINWHSARIEGIEIMMSAKDLNAPTLKQAAKIGHLP